MEVLFPKKKIDAMFLPNLYGLRSPECKKIVFGKYSEQMYVRACDFKMNIYRFIFLKLIKVETQNLYTEPNKRRDNISRY